MAKRMLAVRWDDADLVVAEALAAEQRRSVGHVLREAVRIGLLALVNGEGAAPRGGVMPLRDALDETKPGGLVDNTRVARCACGALEGAEHGQFCEAPGAWHLVNGVRRPSESAVTVPAAGSDSSRSPAAADDPRPSAAAAPAVRLEAVVARRLMEGTALEGSLSIPPTTMQRARRMVQQGRVRVRGIAGPKGDAKDGGECRTPSLLVDPERVEIVG